jgi:hypothetical protein
LFHLYKEKQIKIIAFYMSQMPGQLKDRVTNVMEKEEVQLAVVCETDVWM